MTTTPMTQIQRWQQAWAALLPHVPVPTAADAAPWEQLPQFEVDRAMLRCSRRYAASMISDGFKPMDAYRYVTFVATEAVKAARAKLLKQLQFGTSATTPVSDGAEGDDNIGNRA
jgi:hypothetical protein